MADQLLEDGETHTPTTRGYGNEPTGHQTGTLPDTAKFYIAADCSNTKACEHNSSLEQSTA